jgi:hypothetical protein
MHNYPPNSYDDDNDIDNDDDNSSNISNNKNNNNNNNDFILTFHTTCTREIKSIIATANAAFNRKKTLFTNKLDLNLGKKLVKSCVLSVSLYGAET